MELYVDIISKLPESQKVQNLNRLGDKGRRIFDMQRETSKWLQKGDKMFQLFALYNPMFSAWALRGQMVSYIKFEKEWFEAHVTHLLRQKGQSLDDYLETISQPGTPGDEIYIVALSWMISVHTCVWLHSSSWTTSHSQNLDHCSIHLVFCRGIHYELTMEMTTDEISAHEKQKQCEQKEKLSLSASMTKNDSIPDEASIQNLDHPTNSDSQGNWPSKSRCKGVDS